VFKSKKLYSAILLSLSVLSGHALATDQCYTQAGTFGPTTVTVTGSNCTLPYGNWDGMVMAGSSGGACTFNFSPPISGTGLYIAIGATDSADTVGFEFNGTPYSEIDSVSTPPTAGSGGPLIATSGLIGTTGSGYANGRVNFQSAPSSITSIKLTNVGYSLWSICSGTPPAAPAAIPTLGEWAMIFMASLMAMFGIRRMRRNK
jgi:hypothetical protein